MQSLLGEKPYLVLDGGVSTCLETAGISMHSRLWSSLAVRDEPATVFQIHEKFCASGADILTASTTYQMTFEGLHEVGMDRTAAVQFMHQGVLLAKQAADAFKGRDQYKDDDNKGKDDERAGTVDPITSPPWVAASVGSYGAFLADGSEYHGGYDATMSGRALESFHRDRIATLLSSHCDLLVAETVPCVSEVQALRRLLAPAPKPSWISLSVAEDGRALASGAPIEDAIRVLEDPPEDEPTEALGVASMGVGVNCCAPRAVRTVLETMRDCAHKNRVLVCYPNSGELWDGHTKEWMGSGSGAEGSETEQLVRQWYDAGARVIGGCCRTYPDDTAKLRDILAEYVK